MSEITENIKGYLNELDNYMQRLNEGKLSRNDKRMFLEMSEEYYRIFEEYSAEDKGFPKELLNEIENFNANIINQDVNAIGIASELFERINKNGEMYNNMHTRVELMQDVFQKDVATYRLHDEKIEILQKLVDMDLKIYGKVTDETIAILEVQHCELQDTKVIEIYERELTEEKHEKTLQQVSNEKEQNKIVLHLPRMPRTQFRDLVKQLKSHGAKFDANHKEWSIISDNHNMDFFAPYITGKENGDYSFQGLVAPEQIGAGEKENFRVYAYTRSEYTKPPKPIYGENAEQLVAKLQEYNRTRTEEMKYQTCYVQKLNRMTNKYENMSRYDVITGEDITPIYLNLPHLKPTMFKELVNEIEAAGAMYSPVKKAFYITRQADLNKFAAYLPLSGKEEIVGENRSKKILDYTIESGKEYYDNRVKVTVEGLKPIQIYGDDYDVHFPSMSMEETREIVEKYVLPDLRNNYPGEKRQDAIQYKGKTYNPLQYNVIQMAKQQQFTSEQMALLERPELTADRMNEVRFAISDGLSVEQIKQFGNPEYEQWQMDICRTGMQNGLTYEEVKPLLKSDNYKASQWGERRAQLQKMIHEKNDSKKGLLTKLNHYKGKSAERLNSVEHVPKISEVVR